VYDFSVQIRKIQTGDTAGAATGGDDSTAASSSSNAAAGSAASSTTSSSHHHRHRHHRDGADKVDKSDKKSDRSLKARDSGSLSRNKSARHTESTSPPPSDPAVPAERGGLRRHKSSYSVSETPNRGKSSGRQSPSVTPITAAAAVAAAASAAAKSTPPQSSSSGVMPKPAPPPGAPPGKARTSASALSQSQPKEPTTPPQPQPPQPSPPQQQPQASKAVSTKAALVNSNEKVRRSSSSPPVGDEPVAPAPPAAAEHAPEPPAPTTASRTSATAAAAPAAAVAAAAAPAAVAPAVVREPPLRGHETSSLNESTIRRLRDRQAEASGRLSLLEQWHSGKPKDAQVLEEMTRLGIELADISATLSGEKTVEEFNKSRMAAAVVRKPSAEVGVTKKEGLSDSKKSAKDKKGRSETAPASALAVVSDNATASTSSTTTVAATTTAAPATAAATAAPAAAAAAPAGAAQAPAAASGEPRRSKTLLPKSLQQPKLPEDHVEVAKKLRDILDKPWDQVLVFKDTYRLARRFQVYDGGKRVIDGSSPSLADQSPIKTFCRVVQCIADRLETPPRAAIINKACNAIVATESDAPPDLLIRQLFEQSIGLNSRTAAVFRPVHQGVIMPVTFWLKSKTRLLSKDVATADGWRLLIEFERLACDDDAPADTARDVDGRRVSVTITHYRKEQSLVTELDERFVVEYRLRFRLAPNLLQTSEFDIKFTLVDVDRQRAYPDILAALLPLEQWNKTTPLLKLIEPGPRGPEVYGQLVCIRPDQDGPLDDAATAATTAAGGAAATTTAPAAATTTAPTKTATTTATTTTNESADKSGSRSSSVYSSEEDDDGDVAADDDDDGDDDEAAPPPPEPVEDAALRMSVMAQVVSTGGHLSPSQSTGAGGGSGGERADVSGEGNESPSVSYSDEDEPPPPASKVIVEPLAGVADDDDDDDDDDFIDDESTYSTESGD
jgi:hypothetical protein